MFEERRKKLLEKMAENSCALIFSGDEIMNSEDEALNFKVNRNFFYLTGIDAQSMVLVLTKFGDVTTETLFILPFDELQAKWVGGRMRADEATNISEIKTVVDRSELDSSIAAIMNRSRSVDGFKMYFDLWHYRFNQNNGAATEYAKEVAKRYPNVQITDLYNLIAPMRMIKEENELTCMSKAIDITKDGIHSMMKFIKPGETEMVMAAMFDFVLAKNNCKENAFDTIAASGKRATVLHYRDNDQELKDGELFLCDLGATYNHYCADITRTFPVNGKFTDRQKEIYELVLGAQKLVEANAKPGLTTRDLNNLVIEYYKEELPKHGLDKDVSEYYFHGVSHYIGLDTHDVAIVNKPLEPGNVISNEPGLYLSEEEIGIRIENDLLITEDGCENLAKDIIREVDEIENFMGN